MSTLASSKPSQTEPKKALDCGLFCRVWLYVAGGLGLAWAVLILANAL